VIGILIVLIVACEIGFWCLLGVGLVARYVMRLPRTSAVLLAGAPVLDLVLLVASVVDLRSGSAASAAHGLAAAYIGFSVAFGSTTLRWADQRFAHRFAAGPPPQRPPQYGQERACYVLGRSGEHRHRPDPAATMRPPRRRRVSATGRLTSGRWATPPGPDPRGRWSSWAPCSPRSCTCRGGGAAWWRALG
jgi:hypothetical protein